MIQRFIFTALQNGVDKITANTDLLDNLFKELYDLTPTEVEGIKAFWGSDTPPKGPPKVVHGYAPRDIKVPHYAITLGNEAEKERFLNDDIGQVMDMDDPEFGADEKGSTWTHRYDIMVLAEHPDVVTYYYEIGKQILIDNKDFFDEQGLIDIRISGADLAPDPRYIPEHLFGRRLSFECERLFSTIDRESKLGKAFAIDGLHIDRTGSPSDVGAVKTKIKILEGDT